MQTGSEEHFARVELASQGLNGLNPMAVRIDLYAEARAAALSGAQRIPMLPRGKIE